jgi:hypothetical protein
MPTVRGGNTWLGLTLIALGAAFFAQSYFGLGFRNWWALFILIPAVFAFSTAYYAWKSAHVTTATSQAAIGLVFATVAAIFLIDVPWRLAWPLLFIVAGIGLLLPRLAGGRVP